MKTITTRCHYKQTIFSDADLFIFFTFPGFLDSMGEILSGSIDSIGNPCLFGQRLLTAKFTSFSCVPLQIYKTVFFKEELQHGDFKIVTILLIR